MRAHPGVVAVLTARDVPGLNDVSPSIGGDPLLADGRVMFHGQVLFAVVAETRDAARRAARLADVVIEVEEPSVTVEDAAARGETVLPDYAFERGDIEAALAASTRQGGGLVPHRGAKSTSISKGRRRSPSRRRTGRSSSIPPRSIRPRCST